MGNKSETVPDLHGRICPFNSLNGNSEVDPNESLSDSNHSFHSAESVITISDSDSLIETGDESDPDEESDWFSDSTEDYVLEHYSEEQLRLKTWLISIKRKFATSSELYQSMQNVQKNLRINITPHDDLVAQITRQNGPKMEFVFRMLEDIHSRVKRRDERNRTSFIVLFDLYNLIANHDFCIFLEPQIHAKLCNVLSEWINSACFKVENFPKLKLFLKAHFMASDDNIKSIFLAWQKSQYCSLEKLSQVQSERTFIKTMYFDILTNLVDRAMTENVSYLPTILELGQFNSTLFKSFLEKFSISYSGPYKKLLKNGEYRVQYFLSSCNKADAVLNGNMPLYGVYEFRLCSLALQSDAAAKFVSNLDSLPFWLNHVPPLFNETLEFIRNKC